MSRKYSEDEITYFELKKSFEEEWVENGDAEFNRSLGPHYDYLLAEETGLSVEEFIEKHRTYYSFTEIAEYRLTGKKREKRNPYKSKKDKLAIRLKTGLIAEKGLGFSLLSHEQLLEEMDYKTFWIADCIAWAITDKFGYERDEKLIEAKAKNLQNLAAEYADLKATNPALYDEKVPDVELTSAEIRNKIGRSELLNSDIHKLIERFAGVTIDRKTQRLVADDRDHWIRFGEFRHICTIQYAESGRFSNRNQQPEYCYRFIFDRVESLDFWLSVQMGFFDCRPNSYYKLKGGTQQVIRALCWTPKPTRIELSELCRIAGVTHKNVCRREEIINSYLKEAEEAGFITVTGGEIKKAPGSRKKQIWYNISKLKRLPEK